MRDDLIEKNISLADLSSWRVGGPAEYYTLPQNKEELVQANLWATENNVPITVLGKGTNVLIHDEGIKGLVIHMDGINHISEEIKDDHIHIVAGAGAHKAQAIRLFLKHKLAPALFLTGLPGNIGAGVVMNAGVSEDRVPREFCEIVDWVSVLKDNGQFVKIDSCDLDWSYRTCKGWQPGIIYEVGLKWNLVPDLQVMNKIKEATRLRLSKQPLDKPSCGSTFRNPLPATAGGLIDLCGLKNFSIGGAEVSEKHANFIITKPGSSAQDVDMLIKHIQKVVKDKFDTKLRTEIVYLGNWA